MTNPHVIDLDPNFLAQIKVPLAVNKFRFSGGETHIKLEHNIDLVTDVLIRHRLNSAENIMELLLATDAAKRRFRKVRVSALFPYIPYARQDKVMAQGEPFSLKVFANLINAQNYETVWVLDPHSDISDALIENIRHIDPYYLFNAKDDIIKNFGENFVMVSPDGGALKKIYKNATFIGYKGPIYCATKLRDVSTGKIVRTTLDATKKDLKGKTVWIQDDICSGGRTFIELSKVLKNKGAKHVVLSVSHYEGIADEDKIKDSGIEQIYTTNSISNAGTDLVKRFSI